MKTRLHGRLYRGACLLSLLLATACRPSPPDVASTTRTAPADAAPASTVRAAGDAAIRIAHDDAGQAGVALPEAIARALGTDERVLSCSEGTRDGTSLFAPDWVAVRQVELDGDGRVDWIVNGRHACLRDGDAVGWWLYAGTADAPRLLLAAAMATSLEVLPSRTQGFRDLRLRRAGGDATVRYDGSGYALPTRGADAPDEAGPPP